LPTIGIHGENFRDISCAGACSASHIYCSVGWWIRATTISALFKSNPSVMRPLPWHASADFPWGIVDNASFRAKCHDEWLLIPSLLQSWSHDKPCKLFQWCFIFKCWSSEAYFQSTSVWSIIINDVDREKWHGSYFKSLEACNAGYLTCETIRFFSLKEIGGEREEGCFFFLSPHSLPSNHNHTRRSLSADDNNMTAKVLNVCTMKCTCSAGLVPCYF